MQKQLVSGRSAGMAGGDHSACGLFKVWSRGCRSSNNQLKGGVGEAPGLEILLYLSYTSHRSVSVHVSISDTSNQYSNGKHFYSDSSHYLSFSISGVTLGEIMSEG